MYALEYARPTTLEDAERLLLESGGRPLAGGQSLVGAMKVRLAQPGTVIDLGGIAALRGITRVDDTLRIGAMTRHAEVAESPLVRAALPALARLAGGIGDRLVRNMGTLGGSLSNNDPAACHPCGALALGAQIVTQRRSIAADDFFQGMYETALEPGELVTAVHYPLPQRAAYLKFEQQASRFALVGVCVAQTTGGVRVAITGAAACVFRCAPLEQALTADFSPRAARTVRLAPDDLASDLHATAPYRAHLAVVLAARAVEQALQSES